MPRDLISVLAIAIAATFLSSALLAPELTLVAVSVALVACWMAIAAVQLAAYRGHTLPPAATIMVALTWPAVLFRIWQRARRRRFHEDAVLTAFPRLRSPPASLRFAGPAG